MVVLSLRLRTIAELVPKNANVCDVGTDHGFLPVFLSRRGDIKKIIATDINEKPLKKAEENIKNANIQNISLRLCNGLSGVEVGEVDTVVIAGMGGEVISGIVDRGIDVFKIGKALLITQPTTSPEFLRKFLYDNGFELIEEIPIMENKKIYSVMKWEFTGNKVTKPEWFYFSGLVTSEASVGKLYIEKQKKRCFECMKALEKIPSKYEEYRYYKEIFEGLQNS